MEKSSENGLLNNLKHQSTWRLLGLGIITLGVYFAYYIRNQTIVINEHLTDEEAISSGLVSTFMVLSYISLAILFPYMFVEEGHILEVISDLVDLAWSINLLIWGFVARSKMNFMLSSGGTDRSKWFSGFLTFLFTPLYFNYRVNFLTETLSIEDNSAL